MSTTENSALKFLQGLVISPRNESQAMYVVKNDSKVILSILFNFLFLGRKTPEIIL